MNPSKTKTSLESIQNFLAHTHVAVAGVSRNKQKFGNVIFRELLKKGYKPVPVNPNATELEGHKSYAHPAELPAEVKVMILVTKPDQTLILIKEALKNNIRSFWIQQGAESPEVIEFCEENDLGFITGHCILMFLEPVGSFHKIHRLFSKLFGSYPS